MIKNSLKTLYKKIRKYKNSLAIDDLLNKKHSSGPLSFCWEIAGDSYYMPDAGQINIFGLRIPLENINWAKDYQSGFVFPADRTDKFETPTYFNKGVEVKFPWELSRFYFGYNLAVQYKRANDPKYYYEFKNLVNGWIESNPYLYGVNWTCPMEAAIRGINWIICLNIFKEEVKEDDKFAEAISISLAQHASYIIRFIEKVKLNITTNHTTSNYLGLLFISQTLKSHPDSKKWENAAVKGLLKCIREQTYTDGGNYECSIPYHRLVLEMYGLGGLVFLANGINVHPDYYDLLYRMFEYASACRDKGGHSPQIGDNDSGKIMHIENIPDDDYAPVLEIGQRIFGNDFNLSEGLKYNNPFLPALEKTAEAACLPRKDITGSVSFPHTGLHILRNGNIDVFVSCFKKGMRGVGGHNHYDQGSFTLSYKGAPVIADIGTYTYTKNYAQRNKFKGRTSHNVIISKLQNELKEKAWEYSDIYKVNLIMKSDSELGIEIYDKLNAEKYFRKFEIHENELTIIDEYKGSFCHILHFAPGIKVNYDADNKKVFLYRENGNPGTIEFKSPLALSCEEYEYSPIYGQLIRAERILVQADSKLISKFKFASNERD